MPSIAQVLDGIKAGDGLTVRSDCWFDTSKDLPVIFNGSAGPRHVGFANSHSSADTLAIAAGLSATFNSLAEQNGRKFWLLHG